MILKSQQRFKSEAHCLYTEEINQMMIKHYKLLIELQYIHMEQILKSMWKWDDWDDK